MKAINNYIIERLHITKKTKATDIILDKSKGFEFTNGEIDYIKKFANELPNVVQLITNCLASSTFVSPTGGPQNNCIYLIFSDKDKWLKNINKEDEFLDHKYIVISKKDKKYFGSLWEPHFKDKIGGVFTQNLVTNDFKGYNDLEKLFDEILNKADKLNFF